MRGIGITVIGWVLPIVLGPLVYAIARSTLNVSNRIDDLPPAIKRLAVVAFGTAVVAIFSALGVTAPETCVAIGNGTVAGVDAAQACAVALASKVPVQGVVAALVAMTIHAVKKEKPND